MMRRLVEPTRTRARLFDVKGDIIADSRILRGPGDTVQVLELQAPEREGAILRIADQIYDWILNLLPRHTSYPVYRESALPRADDYPEVMRALRGETGSAIRSDPASRRPRVQRGYPDPALQASARRRHAIDRQRRNRGGAAHRAARAAADLRSGTAGDGAAVVLPRRHHCAPYTPARRGRGARAGPPGAGRDTRLHAARRRDR